MKLITSHSFRCNTIIVAIGKKPNLQQFFIPKRSLLNTLNIITSLPETQLHLGLHPALETADPAEFNLYINWLTQGTLTTKTQNTQEEYQILFKLYLLSELFQDPEFRDAVLDAIITKFNQSNDPTNDAFLPGDIVLTSIYCWDQLRRLRDLVVLMYLRRADRNFINSKRGELPAGFLEDLVGALYENPGPKDPYLRDEDVRMLKATQADIALPANAVRTEYT